jgi:hypothetical protein
VNIQNEDLEKDKINGLTGTKKAEALSIPLLRSLKRKRKTAMLLSPPSSASARRLSGSSSGRSLNRWWQVSAALDADSLEEMLSNDAPEELCDPILMTLYVEPLVSPSGETYR